MSAACCPERRLAPARFTQHSWGPIQPSPHPHSHRRSVPTPIRSTCLMCWGCPCTRWWSAPSGWVSGCGGGDRSRTAVERRPGQQAACGSLQLIMQFTFAAAGWGLPGPELDTRDRQQGNPPSLNPPIPPRLCAQAAALAARSRAQHSSTPPAPSPPTTCASPCGECADRRIPLHVSCPQTPRLCWSCRLLVCGGSLCPVLAAAVRSCPYLVPVGTTHKLNLLHYRLSCSLASHTHPPAQAGAGSG